MEADADDELEGDALTAPKLGVAEAVGDALGDGDAHVCPLNGNNTRLLPPKA